MVKWINKDKKLLDFTKLRCFLSQEELLDSLWLSNVLNGQISTNKLYPLIFDIEGRENERSLATLEDYLTNQLNPTNEPSINIGLTIRDLFLAHSFGHIDKDSREANLLDRCLVNVDIEPLIVINNEQNLEMSYFPTTTFSMVRLMENNFDIFEKNETTNTCFASVLDDVKMNHHRFVFVRPDQLSYHNFENILRLDTWFESKNCPKLFSFTNIVNHKKFTRFKLNGCDFLKELCSLDAFMSPVNTQQRGGKRCIFSSSKFSSTLFDTFECTRNSNFFNEKNFQFKMVNSIFRLNKFVPGDKKFAAHYDTPYYDPRRKQLSRYTFIIYLTSGNAGGEEAALVIDKFRIHDIKQFDCFLFDQKLLHKGSPFCNTDKIFIRTELIFEQISDLGDLVIKKSDQAAISFSIANYLVGHSLLNQNIQSFVTQSYEMANKLHFSLIHKTPDHLLMLISHKLIDQYRFVTNGYDYFFTFDSETLEIFKDVKVCAIFAIIDYFNCGFENDQTFKQVSQMTPLNFVDTNSIDLSDKIFTHIRTSLPTTRSNFSQQVFKYNRLTDIISSLPILQRENYRAKKQKVCCPFHDSEGRFNGQQCVELIDDYKKYHKKFLTTLEKSSFFILGNKICINNLEVLLDRDFVYINDKSGKKIEPINFAACWNGPSHSDFHEEKDIRLFVPDLLIPPIRFKKLEKGYHLMVDFWKNDWMVDMCENADEKVKMPILLESVDLW